MARTALIIMAGLLLQSCASVRRVEAPLTPIRIAGSRWIELSPVLVAANSFYPQRLTVPSGGVVDITRGDADLATNAETQLLRESVNNPDLRIVMTVAESYYRLVARRSAGISQLADLKGKRVIVPRLTSAQYYLVSMLHSVGLKEEDVTLVSMPAPKPGQPADRFRSAEALARGDADVMATFEPEPAQAVHLLGDDAIVLQDRNVYREAFNLHARASDLANPEKRRAIVAFVRAVAQATAALKKNPAPYLDHIADVTGFSIEQIRWGWPETQFPVRIVPDMLDVLEREEIWVAKISNRPPRRRQELAKLIDRSVVEEALSVP